MRTFRFITVIILMMFMTAGCTISPTESTDRISSPLNNLTPILGTWEVAEVVKVDSNKDSLSDEEWKNKTLEFSKGYMTLGDYYLEEPRYQIKQVNLKEYILYSHKAFLKTFNIPHEDIEVITVIDNDKYFCEIVRINENELMLSVHNYNFYLKKVSDEVANNSKTKDQQKETKSFDFMNYNEDTLIRSGVLLGLRSDESDESTYRTVWVSSRNKKLSPIIEAEGIIFPRRSGFWKMETKRIIEDERTEDFLYAHNISTEYTVEARGLQFNYSHWLGKLGQIRNRISYIGNDYVSIETIADGYYEHNSESWYENTLSILPIDSLSRKKSVNIIDISGEDSLSSIKLGIEKTMDSLDIKEEALINKDMLLDSFGLKRKMGHWFFKGRLNYMLNDEFNYADYNINIIPSSELVVYDELSIPWTYIKNKVPEAVDAFSSPNKDIVIVLTRNEAIVYGIEKGEIEGAPIQTINLKDNETVIMAEWATGDYVENWSKTLDSINDID